MTKIDRNGKIKINWIWKLNRNHNSYLFWFMYSQLSSSSSQTQQIRNRTKIVISRRSRFKKSMRKLVNQATEKLKTNKPICCSSMQLHYLVRSEKQTNTPQRIERKFVFFFFSFMLFFFSFSSYQINENQYETIKIHEFVWRKISNSVSERERREERAESDLVFSFW